MYRVFVCFGKNPLKHSLTVCVCVLTRTPYRVPSAALLGTNGQSVCLFFAAYLPAGDIPIERALREDPKRGNTCIHIHPGNFTYVLVLRIINKHTPSSSSIPTVISICLLKRADDAIHTTIGVTPSP